MPTIRIADMPVGDYLSTLEAGIRGWRIALLVGEFSEGLTTKYFWQSARRRFWCLGATIEEVELPFLLQAASGIH
jgi:hypothetical protein